MPERIAYVVCKDCGERWQLAFPDGGSPVHPRACRNEGCDAGWLELSVFGEEADADRAAAAPRSSAQGVFSGASDG